MQAALARTRSVERRSSLSSAPPAAREGDQLARAIDAFAIPQQAHRSNPQHSTTSYTLVQVFCPKDYLSPCVRSHNSF